jgi:4-amino-4-deoxy-L-arabinose transferase-like glycosyltransferase
MQALSGSVRDLAEGRSRWIVSSLLAIIALGIGIRLYVAEALVGKAFNDTAIVGLMTMHELAGRFYAFYWGQSYMGSTESLSIAPFFALFGVNELSLSLGLLPWFVLFTIAIYGLTRLCGGGRAAIIAAFLSATAPAYLQYHEMMPLGGYPETLALGTVLLWLVLRVVYRPLSPAAQTAHLVAIGAVGGLAFWTNWLVLPYFVIVGLYLFLWNPFLLGRSASWLAIAAFVVGSLPFWAYNVKTTSRPFIC